MQSKQRKETLKRNWKGRKHWKGIEKEENIEKESISKLQTYKEVWNSKIKYQNTLLDYYIKYYQPIAGCPLTDIVKTPPTEPSHWVHYIYIGIV